MCMQSPGFSYTGQLSAGVPRPSAGVPGPSAGVPHPSAGVPYPFAAVLHPSVEDHYQHDVTLHSLAEFVSTGI